MNAQFNRALFNIKGVGATNIVIPRNDVIFHANFGGVVQTTVKTPQDAAGQPVNGWNTRAGDYLDSFSNFQSSTTYAITKNVDTFNEAPAAVRFEVRKFDTPSSGSVRSEIVPIGFSDVGDIWYGYSVYWQTWSTFPTSPFHIFQFHPTSNHGSAVLRLECQGDNYQVVHGSSDSAEYYLDTGVPIVTGQWVNFVWHVVWSTYGSIVPGGGRPSGNGTIEVWINGVKVVNKVGNVRTDQFIDGATGQYNKLGINAYGYTLPGNPGPASWVFFIDNFRVAQGASANYNSVAPIQKP